VRGAVAGQQFPRLIKRTVVELLYTRARQVKSTWLKDPLSWLHPAYCLLYLFYFDSETIKSAALAACVLRATTKKIANFFEEKSASGDLA